MTNKPTYEQLEAHLSVAVEALKDAKEALMPIQYDLMGEGHEVNDSTRITVTRNVINKALSPSPSQMAREEQEWLGEEALYYIRTMYPGIWDSMGESVKKSLKNSINNNFNNALSKAISQEREACAKECAVWFSFKGIT